MAVQANNEENQDQYTELQQKYDKLKLEIDKLKAEITQLQHINELKLANEKQVQIHLDLIHKQIDSILENKQAISNPQDDHDHDHDIDNFPLNPPFNDIMIPAPSIPLNPQDDDDYIDEVNKSIPKSFKNHEVIEFAPELAIRDDESSDEELYQNNNPTDEVLTNNMNINIDYVFDFDRCAKHLTDAMNAVYKDHINIDDIDINKITNDFLYLSNNDNADEKFDAIYNKLAGECYISQCKSFKRNTRDRTKYSKYRKSKFNTAKYQIIDKIHCYYAHSYDMCYKLRPYQKQQLLQTENENFICDNDDDDEMLKFLVDKKLCALNKILSQNKQQRIGNNYKQRIKKYKQFTLKPQNYIKNEIGSDQKLYCFGTKFIYDNQSDDDDSRSVKITAIHPTLKNELTDNNISQISIYQYVTEFEKALILHDSDYRRNYYSNMSIEHVLALMIYCNFDQFQHQFSKTYRENINDHREFYHLGKLLKKAIQTYGKSIEDGNVKTFYHGIAEQLLLPSIIDVLIYCPLSTSSSFHVAINFTNINQGLIIEFGAGKTNRTKHLSISWLSDYGNENEHLFVQNKWSLQVNNITDTKLGLEYSCILSAIQMIEKITSGQNIVDDRMQGIAKKIIEHQFSYKIKEYEEVRALSKYARSIINLYCNDKKTVSIHYSSSLLFESETEVINIHLLSILFPNLRSIELENIVLSASILEQIQMYLEITCGLRMISLKANTNANVNDKLDSMSAIKMYEQKFKDIQFNLRIGEFNEHRIYIEKEIVQKVENEKCSRFRPVAMSIQEKKKLNVEQCIYNEEEEKQTVQIVQGETEISYAAITDDPIEICDKLQEDWENYTSDLRRRKKYPMDELNFFHPKQAETIRNWIQSLKTQHFEELFETLVERFEDNKDGDVEEMVFHLLFNIIIECNDILYEIFINKSSASNVIDLVLINIDKFYDVIIKLNKTKSYFKRIENIHNYIFNDIVDKIFVNIQRKYDYLSDNNNDKQPLCDFIVKCCSILWNILCHGWNIFPTNSFGNDKKMYDGSRHKKQGIYKMCDEIQYCIFPAIKKGDKFKTRVWVICNHDESD